MFHSNRGLNKWKQSESTRVTLSSVWVYYQNFGIIPRLIVVAIEAIVSTQYESYDHLNVNIFKYSDIDWIISIQFKLMLVHTPRASSAKKWKIYSITYVSSLNWRKLNKYVFFKFHPFQHLFHRLPLNQY